jgi:hypothetical protein
MGPSGPKASTCLNQYPAGPLGLPARVAQPARSGRPTGPLGSPCRPVWDAPPARSGRPAGPLGTPRRPAREAPPARSGRLVGTPCRPAQNAPASPQGKFVITFAVIVLKPTEMVPTRPTYLAKATFGICPRRRGHDPAPTRERFRSLAPDVPE